jgi:hypothetical protein
VGKVRSEKLARSHRVFFRSGGNNKVKKFLRLIYSILFLLSGLRTIVINSISNNYDMPIACREDLFPTIFYRKLCFYFSENSFFYEELRIFLEKVKDFCDFCAKHLRIPKLFSWVFNIGVFFLLFDRKNNVFKKQFEVAL